MAESIIGLGKAWWAEITQAITLISNSGEMGLSVSVIHGACLLVSVLGWTAVIAAVAVNGCNKIGGGILPAIAALVVFTLIAWVL